MQGSDTSAQVSGRMLLTPFSEGSKPDAFKFIFFSLCLHMVGLGIFFIIVDGQGLTRFLIKIFAVATIILIAAISTLFCRVELSDDQIFIKGLLTKKSARVADINSVMYKPSRIATRLVISTNTHSMAVTSLSFSARQLNTIRNYCEGREICT